MIVLNVKLIYVSFINTYPLEVEKALFFISAMVTIYREVETRKRMERDPSCLHNI